MTKMTCHVGVSCFKDHKPLMSKVRCGRDSTMTSIGRQVCYAAYADLPLHTLNAAQRIFTPD
jgi:hypothetical protein